MTVVTRFPPSPTGFMHIGNARTALFNWLFTKHHGGKFLVRIEDTDRARHSEEAVQVIMNGLDWLELDYDNEPESQYANRDRHIEVVHQLLAAGKAYHCYCSPEELQEMRTQAQQDGRPVAYDRRWRDRDPAEAPEGIKPVIRIKAPLEGQTIIQDVVQGEITIQNDHLDDFILLRSDGAPTYMLAVVVDDHDMGITHVIRGDDHLNNTFRQNLIYNAMGWDTPTHAHCPLILGPDGTKFSKRHGAASVEDYRAMGYLPEALCNYLLRLGWAHGDEEIIPRNKAIALFDLDGINKGAARFDFQKLENLNAHYIKEADNTRLIELISPFLKDNHRIILSELGLSRLERAMDMLKERAKTLIQLAEESLFFLTEGTPSYDDKALKHLHQDTAPVLEQALTHLDALTEFTHQTIEETCRNLAETIEDGKLGKIMMPLRAAVTGSDKSPSLFESLEILGKEETVDRLKAALEVIQHQKL